MTKRKILTSVLAAACAVTLASCSTAGNSTSTTTTASDTATTTAAYLAPPKAGPYKVGLANSFSGNTWRQQMIAEIQYAAANTYKDQVSDLKITDANQDVSTQLQQINDFITSGVDILLIDAASATALNSAIDRAWAAGIQVVTFDNTATSDHAMIVGEDQVQVGKIGGQWLASQLKSGDTVVTLDGAAGNPVNDDRLKGATDALQAAGIQIVGAANTDWDAAKSQAATDNLLTAHPDIAGIYSQGGDSSLGAIKAMQQRGSKVLPIPGEASNGFLKEWQSLNQSDGFDSIAFSSPPQMVVQALDYGIKARQGQDNGQAPTIDIPTITSDNLAQYVRPDLSDSLWLPTMLPEDQLQKLYGANS
jgi:ribose transport system substrate-binding protein